MIIVRCWGFCSQALSSASSVTSCSDFASSPSSDSLASCSLPITRGSSCFSSGHFLPIQRSAVSSARLVQLHFFSSLGWVWHSLCFCVRIGTSCSRSAHLHWKDTCWITWLFSSCKSYFCWFRFLPLNLPGKSITQWGWLRTWPTGSA